MILHPDIKIFNVISESARQMNTQAFVIGGYVRDLILKRPSKDIDIVVAGSGIELAQLVAMKLGQGITARVFKNFGTAMIHYNGWDIEFVGARKESYSRDSRKPFVENGSLEDDQNRRDFTINALAISLQKENYGEVNDPFNGIEDIEKGIIRTPLNPETTFDDDPLRILRAIRFASQLCFTIEDKTYDAIALMKDRLGIISKERITDELNKIILSPKPSYGFQLLDNTNLLDTVFPELYALKGIDILGGKGHKDNFLHTLEVLDKISFLSDNLWLRWAALLHDIGKPATKKFDIQTGWTFHGHDYIGSKMVKGIFTKLKLPLNEKMKYVEKLVQLHLRPIVLSEENVTDSAVRRLLFDASDEIDDLMLLCEADITSKNQEKVKKFLNNFKIVRKKLVEIEEKDKLRNWQPPIDGTLIMETFNITPCREVGIIKDSIREAILEGSIGNNFEDAYQMMLSEGSKLGLLRKSID